MLDVVTVAESTKRTLAAHKVNPGVAAVGLADQPVGIGVKEAVDQV